MKDLNKYPRMFFLFWGPFKWSLFGYSNMAHMYQVWLGWFRIHSPTHTVRIGQMNVHTCTNTRTCTTRENYVSFWAYCTCSHTKCVDRRTTTFPDKDLKYSPSKRFSPGALSLLSMCTFSPSELVLTWRLFFKGLKDEGFDSTSARTELLLFFFQFRRGGGVGGREQRSHIAVFPAENHLMLSRNMLTVLVLFTAVVYMCQTHRNIQNIYLTAKPTGTKKDKHTRKIKKGVDISQT